MGKRLGRIVVTFVVVVYWVSFEEQLLLLFVALLFGMIQIVD